MTRLKEKINEALSSVLPITLIVLLLSATITPMPLGTILLFLAGAVLLIIGMGLFSLGADMAMQPVGEGIGKTIVSFQKPIYRIVITFLIGAFVTIAEPDLTVLAHQVPAIPDMTLILTVAAGVGLFLVVALLRIRWQIDLKYLLIGFYALIFLLVCFSMDSFVAVAFDSGGVTTGPITVPFLMAMGTGMASLSRSQEEEDNFGMVALCSIGPIMAVLLLGIVYHPQDAAYTPFAIIEAETTQDIVRAFVVELPAYAKEVSLALLPIVVFFLAFQLFSRRFSRKHMIRICVGALYTFAGLVLFLTGVNIGFMPAGSFIGQALAFLSWNWVLIPAGMIMGFFIVRAEPAVPVLNRQVEEITSGTIPGKAVLYSLCIGVSLSLGIAMTRILTGIHILYFIIPGYVLALVLSFFVPGVFTGIAFDSGGVASGPLTATFLLPMAMGACEAVGGNILTDAFGIVAMVAMTPLLTIQLLGLLMSVRNRRMQTERDDLPDVIVEFEEEEDE